MARLGMASLVVRGLVSLAIVVAVALPSDVAAAKKASPPSKKPIRNPKFDPSAHRVDLFDAVDAGQVTVKLIPKDALGGTVLIENKTDKPLTVKAPEAVVGASIHAQIGNLFGGNNPGLGNNNGLANQGAGGGQQMQGGGLGMNPGGNPGNNIFGNGQGVQNQGIGQGNVQGNMFGNGFFSIPAEKVISLTFSSVCLEHGKPEPDSASKYTLIPFSKVSSDPVLYQLLAAVGSGKVDPQTAQAAVWHQANKMSFHELAEKSNAQAPGTSVTSYFSQEQIQGAKQLVAQAKELAATLNPSDQPRQKTETAVKAATSNN